MICDDFCGCSWLILMTAQTRAAIIAVCPERWSTWSARCDGNVEQPTTFPLMLFTQVKQCKVILTLYVFLDFIANIMCILCF